MQKFLLMSKGSSVSCDYNEHLEKNFLNSYQTGPSNDAVFIFIFDILCVVDF